MASLIDRYDHISFDLDGTLVHTIDTYRHATTRRAVRDLGGSEPDETAMDRFWFEAGRNRIIEELFKLDPDVFWNHFHVIDTIEGRGRETYAYEDAEPALHRIKDYNKQTSIITGAPSWIAEMEVGKLNKGPVDHYFSITSSEYAEKPDPASFFHVLDVLKSTPKQTLYVGNSNEDALFAHQAGVDFLYLERRKHDFDLTDYAIATIHSLDQLFES